MQLLKILNKINQHSSDIDNNAWLQNSLQWVRKILEFPPDEILADLIPNFSINFYQEIVLHITGIEHVAFMVPNGISYENLKAAADLSGFPICRNLFPSVLVAKELGQLIGKEEVPTKIFKAFGQNNKGERIGVEIFIPEANLEVIDKWINQGICTHIALTASSKRDFFEIEHLFTEQHIKMADFLCQKALQNPFDGSLSEYFDFFINSKKYRLEITICGEEEVAA